MAESPAEIVRRAREQVEELFGKPVEGVAGISRNGSRGWVVQLELLELARIPDTTSLLGSYEAHLDANGNLVDAKRLRRYARNHVDSMQRKEGDE
jgi:hypothetical protein